jgi:hypothetical protein
MKQNDWTILDWGGASDKYRHVFGEPEKMGSGSPQATVAAGSPDCGVAKPSDGEG